MNHKIIIKILRMFKEPTGHSHDDIRKKLNIKLDASRYYWDYIITKKLCEHVGDNGKYKLTFAGIDYLEQYGFKNKVNRYFELIITGAVSGLIVLIVGYYLVRR